MTTPAPQTYIPPQGRSRLLTTASVPTRFTANVEVDARTALTRGLAEYIEQLSFTAAGGRALRFKRVLDGYAEPEQLVSYPSCIVMTTGAAQYEARSFTPTMDYSCRLPPPDGRYLVVSSDYVQDLTVQLWATDPAERQGFVQMLELALNPVLYRYGFVLELPFYFNQRAVYELKDLSYEDSEDDSVKRYRKASFTLKGTVPLTRLVSAPDAKPAFDLRAVGSGALVLLTVEVA